MFHEFTYYRSGIHFHNNLLFILSFIVDDFCLTSNNRRNKDPCLYALRTVTAIKHIIARGDKQASRQCYKLNPPHLSKGIKRLVPKTLPALEIIQIVTNYRGLLQ